MEARGVAGTARWASLLLTLAASLALAAVGVGAAPANDLVTELPGWSGPQLTAMYSGFVPAGSDVQAGKPYTMIEQYVFFECENDPETAPVLVWTNGGPGAASYFGLFVEGIGPYLLTGESMLTAAYNETGIPTLFRSASSWTSFANVLILNSPAPVGYSYCAEAGVGGNGTSCGNWNDTRTANMNAAFIENWARRFPEFANAGREWMIVGESYAGVYVPTLVRTLLANESSLVGPLLTGLALGDPCLGLDVVCGPGQPGPYYYIEFLHGHGQFSDKLYNQIREACPTENLIASGCAGCSTQCKALISQIAPMVGGYYSYNLYDECWYQNVLDTDVELARLLGDASVEPRTYWGPPQVSPEAALNGYPCGGPGALTKWVTDPTVMTALHVPKNANWFSGDNAVGFNYTLTEHNLMPFLKELAMSSKVHVLVYNGDTDPAINSFLTQNWTSAVGLSETEAWRAWTLDGKQAVGGYVTRYKANPSSSFDFLTIRGSGHMVPEYQPRSAHAFMSTWVAHKEFPKYVKPTRRGRDVEL